MGTNPSPAELSSAKLAAEVAWFVFFGPIAAAGLTMLWFTVRKLGALDGLVASCEDRAAQVHRLHAGSKPHDSHVFCSEENSHDGLESLTDEKVARLRKMTNRAAILLGLSAGTFSVVIGVFGLILVSSPRLGSSIFLTVAFAISSGISILVGLKVLHRTLRKENNAWLLPLRLFMDVVLRRHRLSADDDKSRLSDRVR